jgi:hypothetical protein
VADAQDIEPMDTYGLAAARGHGASVAVHEVLDPVINRPCWPPEESK